MGRGGEESRLGNIVLVTKTQCSLRHGPGFLSTNTKFSAATTVLASGFQRAARLGCNGATGPPRSPRPNLGAEINHLSPRVGPLSQVIAVPLLPPEKKHKSMPDRQPQRDLFTAVKKNLIPVLGAVGKAGARYQPLGEQRNEPGKAISAPHTFPLLSFFRLFY